MIEVFTILFTGLVLYFCLGLIIVKIDHARNPNQEAPDMGYGMYIFIAPILLFFLLFALLGDLIEGLSNQVDNMLNFLIAGISPKQ